MKKGNWKWLQEATRRTTNIKKKLGNPHSLSIECFDMSTKNIYILRWQSNAQWATQEKYSPTNDTIQNWEIFDYEVTKLNPMNDYFNLWSSVGFSIEMPFSDLMSQEWESGIFLKSHFTGRVIWDNPDNTDMNYLTWELFPEMMEKIERAREIVLSQWHTPVIKAIFWIHWEWDSTRSVRASNYAKNLRKIIHSWRIAVQDDEIPFISLLVNDEITQSTYKYVDVVRGQMNQLAVEDENFYLVSSEWTTFTDWVHYDKNSMNEIWKRFFEVVKDLQE